jgi:hypothetical protein
MLCGADAQPECIPYIFISCGIAGMCAEASCVRSGLRWTIDEDEFERSSGEHVSLSGTYPVVAGARACSVLEHPATFFHRVWKKKIATLDCELL